MKMVFLIISSSLLMALLRLNTEAFAPPPASATRSLMELIPMASCSTIVPPSMALSTHRHFDTQIALMCPQRQRDRNKSHEISAKKTSKKQARGGRGNSTSGKGFGGASAEKKAKLPINVNYSPAIPITGSKIKNGVGVKDDSNGRESSGSVVHDDLITWLEQNPITFINPKFSIRPSVLGGYGGFVSEQGIVGRDANFGLKRGEIIFRIPRESCVTYDHALLDQGIRDDHNGADLTLNKLFRQIKQHRIPSWGMVIHAGWLAKEYLLSKKYGLLQNEKSIYGDEGGDSTVYSEKIRQIQHLAYIRTLPWKQHQLNQDHVLFWSDEKVESLLQGSLAYGDAILIRKTVENAIRMLRAAIGNVLQKITDAEIDDAIKSAFVINLSRSFAEEVESDNGAIDVESLLLPLLDILQHSNTPNTVLESYDEYILLRANRDVTPGEELFHQYQEEDERIIPPHKWFTRYGFIPGINVNIEDLLKEKSPLFFES